MLRSTTEHTPATAAAHTLRRAAARHRRTLALGFVLGGLGLAYGMFGALRFGSPRLHEDFDRPVARLALVALNCGAERRQFEPATEHEARLLADLEKHAMTTAHLLVLLIRGLIASMLFSAGAAGIAAGVSEARLLRAFAVLGVDTGAQPPPLDASG